MLPCTWISIIISSTRRLYFPVFIVIAAMFALSFKQPYSYKDSLTIEQAQTIILSIQEHPDSVALRKQVMSEELELMIQNSNDSLLVADFYFERGNIQTDSSNLTEAITSFKKSAFLYQLMGDNHGFSIANNGLGVIYDYLGDYDEALFHYHLSLNNLGLKDYDNLLSAHNNIALIYLSTADYDKSKSHLFKAIEICKKIKETKALTFPYHNLGDLFLAQNQYDSALYYYEQSYLIDLRENDLLGIGINLSAMAKVYTSRHDFNRAFTQLSQALVYLKKSGDSYYLGEGYINMSELLLEQAKYEEALSYAKLGLDQALEISAKHVIQQAAYTLGQIYEEIKVYDKALQYTQIHQLYKDSLFNEEKNRRIAMLQWRQSESEKTMLMADNELQAVKMNDQQLFIEKQTFVVIGLTFGFIISVLFLIILKNANREKMTANAKLTEQKNKIESINARLQELNKDIEEQKNQLEESNHIKDRLISIISHDFRSPLNSLEGVLMLFTNNQLDESDLKNIAHDLRIKVNKTTNQLDNLLNWAKNQMQGIIPSPIAFDLSKLTSDTIQIVGLQAENKGIRIVNKLANIQLPTVFADYEMTQLVVRNLLNNAIKFTDKCGQVSITAQRHPEFFDLTIQDSGVGMTGEQLATLFTQQTLSTLGTSHEKGTGLGLMLCKDFMMKMGGKINVSSAPSEGSSFTISIPLYTSDQRLLKTHQEGLKHV